VVEVPPVAVPETSPESTFIAGIIVMLSPATIPPMVVLDVICVVLSTVKTIPFKVRVVLRIKSPRDMEPKIADDAFMTVVVVSAAAVNVKSEARVIAIRRPQRILLHQENNATRADHAPYAVCILSESNFITFQLASS
jgi:hypothetical protein